MNKTKKIIKALFVFAIIVLPFIYAASFYFINVFNFDISSKTDWQLIKNFWQKGGVIKTSKDYLLLFSIILTPVLFIITWCFLYKKNILTMLFYPFEKYSKYIASRHEEQTKRILLKNICRSDEDKEAKEPKADIEASKKASQNIREAVMQKLTNN